jgi:hypothetical protein
VPVSALLFLPVTFPALGNTVNNSVAITFYS